MCDLIRYQCEVKWSRHGSLDVSDPWSSSGNVCFQAVRVFLLTGPDRRAGIRLCHSSDPGESFITLCFACTEDTISSSESQFLDMCFSDNQGWRRSSSVADVGSGSASRIEPSFEIHISRRIEFLDLLFRIPNTTSVRQSPPSAAVGQGIPPIPQGNLGDSGPIVAGAQYQRPVPLFYGGKRKLPPVGSPMDEDPLASPFCIPFLRFFQGVTTKCGLSVGAHANFLPFELSLSFRSPDPDQSLLDRSTSIFLRQWIGRFFEPGVSIVFPKSREAWNFYGQYWSGPEESVDVSISVTTTDRERSIALAHLVSSQIVAPGYLECDVGEVTMGDSEGECGVTKEWFGRRGLLFDPFYQGFISRMSRRFTVEEASALTDLLVGVLTDPRSVKSAGTNGA